MDGRSLSAPITTAERLIVAAVAISAVDPSGSNLNSEPALEARHSNKADHLKRRNSQYFVTRLTHPLQKLTVFAPIVSKLNAT